MFLLAGLALAGFGGAGLAARTGTADVVTTTSSCTKAHPCSNPACGDAGHGAGDCTDPATTSTSPPPPPTTLQSSCTRAHPCANPGCTEAGHGPLDCFDVTTGTTTAPPPPPPTTQTSPATTSATTTTTSSPVPPAATTATSTTSTTQPAPTTTSAATTTALSGTPGGPFVPPPLRTPHRPAPSPHGSPVARTLPYTGANLTLVLKLAFGLLGAGLVLVAAGRRSPRASFAGVPAPASVLHDPTTASSRRPSVDYRVIVPGVGTFATAADALSFMEDRAKSSYRDNGTREPDGE